MQGGVFRCRSSIDLSTSYRVPSGCASSSLFEREKITAGFHDPLLIFSALQYGSITELGGSFCSQARAMIAGPVGRWWPVCSSSRSYCLGKLGS